MMDVMCCGERKKKKMALELEPVEGGVTGVVVKDREAHFNLKTGYIGGISTAKRATGWMRTGMLEPSFTLCNALRFTSAGVCWC